MGDSIKCNDTNVAQQTERVESVLHDAVNYLNAFDAEDQATINEIWANTDVPALVTLLAGWLVKTQKRNLELETILHLTSGVITAGVSRMDAWRVVQNSNEKGREPRDESARGRPVFDANGAMPGEFRAGRDDIRSLETAA